MQFFLDDIDNINVNKIGSKIHFHKEFYPKGNNVNFVKIFDTKHDIKICRYERGVESEILSCGSGSIASIIISGIIKIYILLFLYILAVEKY